MQKLCKTAHETEASDSSLDVTLTSESAIEHVWLQIESADHLQILPTQSIEFPEGDSAPANFNRWRVVGIFGGLIALGFMTGFIIISLPEISASDHSSLSPSQGFPKSDLWNASLPFEESQPIPSPRETPEPSQKKIQMPCIQACEQLFDLEVLISTALTDCTIEEQNSKDCMQILWCIACRI
jgi:hypothetical protein